VEIAECELFARSVTASGKADERHGVLAGATSHRWPLRRPAFILRGFEGGGAASTTTAGTHGYAVANDAVILDGMHHRARDARARPVVDTASSRWFNLTPSERTEATFRTGGQLRCCEASIAIGMRAQHRITTSRDQSSDYE
jgi:hypothetical protein